MDIISYSLEEEMKKDSDVIAHLENRDIAVGFYRALCNMRWQKVVDIPEEEQAINKLKGINPTIWSCSWRYAGGVVADIRNVNYNYLQEDYLDFYCSGGEGDISPLVESCFKRMGWIPCPWDPDDE